MKENWWNWREGEDWDFEGEREKEEGRRERKEGYKIY